MTDTQDPAGTKPRRTAPKAKAETIVQLQPKPAIGAPASRSTPASVTALPISPVPTLNPLELLMTATQDFTKFFPSYEQVVAFHKGNFEALVQANTLLAKGAQEISKEFFAHAQAHLQEAATAGQAVLKAKNLQDAVSLNVETAKAHYETFVATSTKLGELSVKVATEALAPVTARLNVAVETFTKPAVVA
jgi:phasin family protein